MPTAYDFDSLLLDAPAGATTKPKKGEFDFDSLMGVTGGAVEAPPAERTVMGTAKDALNAAMQGGVGVVEAGVGLANVVTGGRAGKFVEDNVVDLKGARKFWNDNLQSDAQKAADKKVDEAEGFVGTVKAAVQNPSTIARTVVESLPSVAAGGFIGRGVAAVAPKLAAWAGAIGEGAISGGASAESVRQQTESGTLEGTQSALAVGSGALVALIGRGGSAFSKKLGIVDVDDFAAGVARADPAKKAGIAKRIIGAAASEGLIEEMPQSAVETMASNISLDKPLMEGVEEAMGMGVLAGAAMGAGTNLRGGGEQAPDQAPPPAAATPVTPSGGTKSRDFAQQAFADVLGDETVVEKQQAERGLVARSLRDIAALDGEAGLTAAINLLSSGDQALGEKLLAASQDKELLASTQSTLDRDTYGFIEFNDTLRTEAGITGEQAPAPAAEPVPTANTPPQQANTPPENLPALQAQVDSVRSGLVPGVIIPSTHVHATDVNGLAQAQVTGPDGMVYLLAAKTDQEVQGLRSHVAEVGLEQAAAELSQPVQGKAVMQSVSPEGAVLNESVVAPDAVGSFTPADGGTTRVRPVADVLAERRPPPAQAPAPEADVQVGQDAGPAVDLPPGETFFARKPEAPKAAEKWTASEQTGAAAKFIDRLNASHKLTGPEAIARGSLTEVTPSRNLQRLVRSIGTAFGTKVVFVHAPQGLVRENGKNFNNFSGVADRSTNTIFMNVEGNAALATLGHELAHILETQHPAIYDKLEVVVLSRMRLPAAKALKARLGAAMESESAAEGAAIAAEFRREVVAEGVGEMAQDDRLWTDIFSAIGQEKTLAKQFYDAVLEVIAKIQRVITTSGYMQGASDVAQVKKAIVSAYKEWAETYGRDGGNLANLTEEGVEMLHQFRSLAATDASAAARKAKKAERDAEKAQEAPVKAEEVPTPQLAPAKPAKALPAVPVGRLEAKSAPVDEQEASMEGEGGIAFARKPPQEIVDILQAAEEEIGLGLVDAGPPAYKMREDKLGNVTVLGDAEEIRSVLPSDLVGRATSEGLVFTGTQAHRVKAFVESGDARYSRAGAISQHARYSTGARKGQYIGAPGAFNTPAKITGLRKLFLDLANEGVRGRFWYEESGKAVLRYVGGDVNEARKFLALLATYSPQAKVNANTTMALSAWAQYKQGAPIDTKTEVMDAKATAALKDPDAFWSGEKTSNFFLNLLRSVDPKSASKQGATVDMWMMRAALYNSDAPTSSQYKFVEIETNIIAKELGWEPQQVQAAIWTAIKSRVENKGVKKATEALSTKKGWMHYETGPKGKPVRVVTNEVKHRQNWLKHALAYTPNDEDLNTAAYHYGSALAERSAQLSWEATPGRTTGSMRGIHEAPMRQQVEYLDAIVDSLKDSNGRDVIDAEIGALVDKGLKGYSGWGGDDSVGMQQLAAVYRDSDGVVDKVSRSLIELGSIIRGIILRQEGMAWHIPIFGGGKYGQNGVEYHLGRQLGADQTAKLYAAISQELGVTSSPPIPTKDGFRVLQFPGEKFALLEEGLSDKDRRELQKTLRKKNADFAAAVNRAVESQGWGLDVTDVVAFESDGNLIENDWSNGYDDYRRAAQESIRALGSGFTGSWGGRSDLFEWIERDLRPRVVAVNERFTEKYGWDNPSFSRQFAAGPDEGRGGRAAELVRAERDAPTYGTPVAGSTAATGWHYSAEQRSVLSSAAYGTGLKGSGREAFLAAKDPRSRQRIYFYLDKGQGIHPEAGVGGKVHEVNLANLYDADADGLGLKKGTDWEAFETGVMDAGFDGFIYREHNQSAAAVLIGQHSVPVAARATNASSKATVQPLAPKAPASRKEGSELVRKPDDKQLLELIRNKAALQAAASTYRMEYGSARVEETEAAAANEVLAAAGSSFSFSRIRTGDVVGVAHASSQAEYEHLLKNALAASDKDRTAIGLALTSKPLQALGADAKTQVVLAGVLRKMHFDHGITESELKSLPELLAQPMMILRNPSREGTWLVVTELLKGGSPVLVPIDPRGEVGRIELPVLRTGFAKDDPDALTRYLEKNLVAWADQKRSRWFSTTSGRQLPGVVQRASGFRPKYITDVDVKSTPAEWTNVTHFSRDFSVAGQTESAAEVSFARNPLKLMTVAEERAFTASGKVNYELGDAIERGQWADAFMLAKDPAQRKALLRKLGDKAIELFPDSKIKVSRWIEGLGLSNNLKQSLEGDLRRSDTIRSALETDVKDQFTIPMMKAITAAAKATGRSSDEVKKLAGSWMSARYSPKASAMLILKDRTALLEAQATGDASKIAAAQKDLNDRILSVNGAVGDVKTRGVGGGRNNAEAAEVVANVEAKLTQAQLQAIAAPIYAMMEWRKAQDISSGKVTQTAVNSWLNDPEYIPLTGDPRADRESTDVFSAGGQVNQEADHAMNGRSDSVPDDGIDAAHAGVLKSINFAAMQDFKRGLNQAYTEAQAAGVDIGLTREPVTGIMRTGDDVIIFRDTQVRPNGTEFTNAQAFRFKDTRIMEALRKDNQEHLNSALRFIAAPTRWYARAVTQFMPFFAPINMVRDIWERSELLRPRKLYAADGSLIDTKKAARASIMGVISRDLWKASMMKAFKMGGMNPIRGDLEEFIRLGGSSTTSEFLKRTSGDLEAEIRFDANRLGHATNKLNYAVEGWNNTFEMIPSLSIFRSLKAQGMTPKDAAAATLDLMNFRKTGTAMPAIRAFYVFAQPAATGGYNLAKYLSTKQGRVRFITQAAIATAAYAMLKAVWGDDEDEEIGNKLDNISNFTAERSIPVKLGDFVLKLPVGFGPPQLAWLAGVTVNRWAAGRYDGVDAIGELAKGWAKSFAPISPSEMELSKRPVDFLVQTFMPTVLKPIISIATDQTAFGAPLTPTPNRDKLKSEQAMRTTPGIYSDIARELHDTIGVDVYPDHVRALVDGYLVGPLRMITNLAVYNPAKKQRGEPEQLVLTSSLIDTINERHILNAVYFREKNELDAIHREVKSLTARGEHDRITPEMREAEAAYKTFHSTETMLGLQRSALKRNTQLDDETRADRVREIEERADAARRKVLVRFLGSKE